jgi:hypothetical protein
MIASRRQVPTFGAADTLMFTSRRAPGPSASGTLIASAAASPAERQTRLSIAGESVAGTGAMVAGSPRRAAGRQSSEPTLTTDRLTATGRPMAWTGFVVTSTVAA